MRPTLFIGSSSEALPIAETMFSLLERRGIEPTVWNQGVFGLNTSGLEALMAACRSYDYACFILRKDDLSISRGRLVVTTRDNVILELGLFLGALGRDRVFVVFERGNKPDLPSDLDGITFLDYDPERAARNLKAAMTTPCVEIVENVKRRASHSGAETVLGQAAKFKIFPLDEENSRWRNITNRINLCQKGELVRFISVTGKNFLLPNFQEGEAVTSRLGPRALYRGVRLEGIVLDPQGVEAEFRSSVESPHARREHRLLFQDAVAVAGLPVHYDESYGLGPSIRKNLALKYSKVGLSFGLWLFSDIAYMEAFHFGKRRPVPHLCGFAQVAVEKGVEEFDLLDKHFDVLWRSSEYVPWCKRASEG